MSRLKSHLKPTSISAGVKFALFRLRGERRKADLAHWVKDDYADNTRGAEPIRIVRKWTALPKGNVALCAAFGVAARHRIAHGLT